MRCLSMAWWWVVTHGDKWPRSWLSWSPADRPTTGRVSYLSKSQCARVGPRKGAVSIASTRRVARMSCQRRSAADLHAATPRLGGCSARRPVRQNAALARQVQERGLQQHVHGRGRRQGQVGPAQDAKQGLAVLGRSERWRRMMVSTQQRQQSSCCSDAIRPRSPEPPHQRRCTAAGLAFWRLRGPKLGGPGPSWSLAHPGELRPVTAPSSLNVFNAADSQFYAMSRQTGCRRNHGRGLPVRATIHMLRRVHTFVTGRVVRAALPEPVALAADRLQAGRMV